jgi:hypothetical protein
MEQAAHDPIPLVETHVAKRTQAFKSLGLRPTRDTGRERDPDMWRVVVGKMVILGHAMEVVLGVLRLPRWRPPTSTLVRPDAPKKDI